MKLVIQKRREFLDLTKEKIATGEYYYDYEEIEIENFMWGKNHEFSYVKKGSNIWSKLKENEEIVGLRI